MGEVFVARDAESQSENPPMLALKLLLPHLSDEEEFVQMFLDEARIAAQMHHPNIVQLFDLGEAAGRYYLAMALVEGVSLSRLLKAARAKNERFPLALVRRIALGLCAGLTYAHELKGARGEINGVVHRDVSPANLLLSITGDVLLTDFGIAKAEGTYHRSHPTRVRGKYAYMAPEQMRTDGVIDARADIFSAAVTLYEALTLESPFAKGTEPETIDAILRSEPRDVREFRADTPEPIAEALMKCLSKDAADRLETADALAAAFRGGIEGTAAELGGFLERLCGDEIVRAKMPKDVPIHEVGTRSLVLHREPSALATVMYTRPLDGAGDGEDSQPSGSSGTSGTSDTAMVDEDATAAISPDLLSHANAATSLMQRPDIESDPMGASISGESTGAVSAAPLDDVHPTMRMQREVHPSAAPTRAIHLAPGDVPPRPRVTGERRLQTGERRLPTGERRLQQRSLDARIRSVVRRQRARLSVAGFDGWRLGGLAVAAVGIFGLGLWMAFSGSGDAPSHRTEPLPEATATKPDAGAQMYEGLNLQRDVATAVAADAQDGEGEKEPGRSGKTGRRPGLKGSVSRAGPGTATKVGYLTAEAQPWAWIVLGGRTLDRTPLNRYPLAPGEYWVVFRNPTLKREERRKVRIEEGRAVSLKVDLRQ